MRDQRKLNVLFLPSRYPTEQLPLNGEVARAHAKAVSLKHNVAVLYLANLAGTYRDYDDDGVRTIKRGIRFSGMGVGLVRYLQQGLRDFTHIHRQFKPDIIHVHVAYPAGLLALVISRRYHVPMVLTEQADSLKVFKEGVVKNLLAHRIVAAMKVICPINRATQNLLEDYSKGPFVIVPNIIDPHVFYYQPQPERSADEAKRLLAVSMLTDNKGIGYLLRGLGQLQQKRGDFHLDIVGEGPQLEEYEALAKELQLEDRVKFLGARARTTVATLLQESDFAVIPSLYDIASPIAVAALTSGKPVVSSRWIGADELINDKVGVLVERASAEALRDGIDWMLDHYHDYDPQAIVAYANSRYGASGVADQFDAVYRRALT